MSRSLAAMLGIQGNPFLEKIVNTRLTVQYSISLVVS
jgi:hypothetical protein